MGRDGPNFIVLWAGYSLFLGPVFWALGETWTWWACWLTSAAIIFPVAPLANRALRER